MNFFTAPFEVMIMFIFKLCVGIGWLLMGGLQHLFTLGLRHNTRQKNLPSTSAAEDTARLADCEEVVNTFLLHLGFIAREAISREELTEKVENGITKDELVTELVERIGAVPGIVLGSHTYQGYEIKLPYSWMDRHIYVIGRSGSGKTNLLRSMIFQNLAHGAGIGILAPEQELFVDELLPYIPPDRIDDVVYVNPADTEYAVSFNPLSLDAGEDLHQKYEDTFTIIKRIMGDTGARMDYILQQSLYALLERPGSTLLDIERLLNPFNDTLRREIIATSNDEQVVDFFRDSYPNFSKDAHYPIASRLSPLLRSEPIRNLLCQSGRSFNFRQAMDGGKILLFNLADGILGRQTSQLLGQFIVSKLQLAVMSRADTPKAARTPFYLYLDEFQSFTGVNVHSYSALLSRARKYKLGLTLLHQQTGQIPNQLLSEILGNVSTLLCFDVAHDDATKLAKEFVIDMGGESENLTPQDFLRLKVGEAWGKIGKNVFPLRTFLMDQNPDPIRAKEVIERSRKNYGARIPKRIDPPKKDLPPDDEELPDPGDVF